MFWGQRQIVRIALVARLDTVVGCIGTTGLVQQSSLQIRKLSLRVGSRRGGLLIAGGLFWRRPRGRRKASGGMVVHRSFAFITFHGVQGLLLAHSDHLPFSLCVSRIEFWQQTSKSMDLQGVWSTTTTTTPPLSILDWRGWSNLFDENATT